MDDPAITAAMRLVWERMKVVIEPSAAVPVAAVLSDDFRALEGIDRIGVVLSGGNIMAILILTIGVILIVAFSTYFERKVIGKMQARVGPNRVGPKGLGQPFADVIKLLVKEVIVPSKSNRFLFVIAPLLTLIPALATWAVIPLNDWFVIADINAGLLYVLALTSVGVYGVILAGWATNSKYAFLGTMRSAAQIVAYEIAMGFALVGVLMAGGSLNLGDDDKGRYHEDGRPEEERSVELLCEMGRAHGLGEDRLAGIGEALSLVVGTAASGFSRGAEVVSGAGGAAEGALFMAVFGLGTAPAMIGVTWASGRSGTFLTARRRQLLGWLLVLFGAWTMVTPLQKLAGAGHAGHAMPAAEQQQHGHH